jgi:hypothetical protein
VALAIVGGHYSFIIIKKKEHSWKLPTKWEGGKAMGIFALPYSRKEALGQSLFFEIFIGNK